MSASWPPADGASSRPAAGGRWFARSARGVLARATARRLWLTDRTVETHVHHLMVKLGVPTSPDEHRRVLAVLAYLRSAQ